MPDDTLRSPDAPSTQRLWVNEKRTVLVRFWAGGAVEVALREEPGDIWGPPIRLREERSV